MEINSNEEGIYFGRRQGDAMLMGELIAEIRTLKRELEYVKEQLGHLNSAKDKMTGIIIASGIGGAGISQLVASLLHKGA